MDRYQKVHAKCTGNLGKGADDDNNGRLNMTVHRRLYQAATNPDLDSFFTKSNSAVRHVNTFYHKNDDHGARFYNLITREGGIDTPLYDSPTTLGLWAARFSPKLQQMALMAHLVCNVYGRRLVIFTDWPITQWNARTTKEAHLGEPLAPLPVYTRADSEPCTMPSNYYIAKQEPARVSSRASPGSESLHRELTLTSFQSSNSGDDQMHE